MSLSTRVEIHEFEFDAQNLSRQGIVKEIGPFVFALIGALSILTYIPAISIWLPRVLNH